MNMPNVSAPPRELSKPVARETREPKKLDDVETEATAETKSDDNEDGTRSVQDLIAAAMKMFANAEPKPEIAATVPAVELGIGPKIEHAVQQILDQIVAKPTAKTIDDTDKPAANEAQTPEAPISIDSHIKAEPAVTPKGPVATTAVRDPAPLPENENPSHVHLVLDDGPERVVVTVAVRGNEVNAMIRGGDEQTAAAIARNAASLDHALRARGLDLSSFSSERDLEHRERQQSQQKSEEEETP